MLEESVFIYQNSCETLTFFRLMREEKCLLILQMKCDCKIFWQFWNYLLNNFPNVCIYISAYEHFYSWCSFNLKKYNSISFRVSPHTTPPRCSASTPTQTSPTRANSLKTSWTPSWASSLRTAPAGAERPERPSWVDWQTTCWRNCLQILFHSR